jgi:prepilin-type N-terminal cleavage/methylation domain-containing protein
MRNPLPQARRPSGDAGLTLVEMLTAMVVGSIVMSAAFVMFTTAQRANATSIARQETVNQAKVSVEAIGRNLRTAIQPNQLEDTSSTDVAFVQGGPRAVAFYANVDNADNLIGPSRVTYAVDASSRLVQTIQRPLPHAATDHNYQYCDPSLASCAKSIQVLATGVDPAAQLFTYYDDQEAVLVFDPTCTCLTATNLGVVSSVEVKLVLTTQAAVGATAVASTTYVLRIGLPNRDSVVREHT